MTHLIVRPETPADEDAIRSLNVSAFGRDEEARLVDALRSNGRVVLSLVALQEGRIVGHILFFPLLIEGNGHYPALGLGPIAVLPEMQRQGVGTRLVQVGLELLRTGEWAAQCGGVIVLGHPEYYPRFGFAPASRFGIECPFAVPDEFFMALELSPGGLEGQGGKVVYTPEFKEV